MIEVLERELDFNEDYFSINFSLKKDDSFSIVRDEVDDRYIVLVSRYKVVGDDILSIVMDFEGLGTLRLSVNNTYMKRFIFNFPSIL